MGSTEKIAGNRENAKRSGEPSRKSSPKRKTAQMRTKRAQSQRNVQIARTKVNEYSQDMADTSKVEKRCCGCRSRQPITTAAARRYPSAPGSPYQRSV